MIWLWGFLIFIGCAGLYILLKEGYERLSEKNQGRLWLVAAIAFVVLGGGSLGTMY